MHRLILLPVAWLVLASISAAGDLIGVHIDSGQLFSISTANAAVTSIGYTHVSGLGSLVRAPDGFLYAVRSGSFPTLWRIDPATALATEVGLLGVSFVVEGGLALDANGVAWGTLVPGNLLYKIDLATGAAMLGANLGVGFFDLNDIVFRSDGALMAIDRPSNSLIRIDVTSGAVTPIAVLSPALGAEGGMTVLGGTAYFSTGGSSGSTPGTNELWSVDLYTGAHTLVGSLGPSIAGGGISGIAAGGPTAFTLFCSGDGSDAPCPCANQGQPGRGCENSLGTGGALLLYASGTTNPDTLVLYASGELSFALTILLQGNATSSPAVVFGDGLRCANGNLVRLYVKSAVSGAVRMPEIGDPSITARSAALGDPISQGERRYYQTYYRDPSPTFCPTPSGNTFNSSNTLKIVW